MPGLRRLDLKLVPLQSKHLPELLKAAGDNCAQLESLVLPRKPELKEIMQGGSRLRRCWNGIIDYIRRVLALNYYTGKSRELQIHIGGLQHGHFGVPTFYSAVVDMLRCLSEISEEDFGAEINEQKFEVFLGNPYHSRVSKEWSSKYMQEELKPLMKRVREMHPSVMVNASLNGVSDDSFSKMDMFSMSWLPKDKGRPMFWETEEDEDYTEHDICDHPPELMNVYYEVLGINPQDEERVARDVDFEDYVERDVWRY